MSGTASLRRVAVTLVAATLATGALLPGPALARGQDPPEQPEGQLGVRLLEAPTSRADDPRARVFVVDHVNPGASFSRRMEVVNTTDRTLPVALYPAGAEIAEGTWRAFDGREQSQASRWVSVVPDRVEVPAGGRTEVVIEVAVPTDVAAGERYAVVWAEPPPGQGEVVTVRNRVGIRVYLSVGPGGEPVTDFVVDSVVARRRDDGTPVLDALVRNTGGRAIDPTGELELRDGPAGLSAGPFASEPGVTIAPGGQASLEFRLDPELPEGPWLAHVDVRSGRVARSAEAEVTFPESAGEAGERVAVVAEPSGDGAPEGARGVVLPVAGGLLAVAVLALVVFLVWRRRRDEDDEQARAAAARLHDRVDV